MRIDWARPLTEPWPDPVEPTTLDQLAAIVADEDAAELWNDMNGSPEGNPLIQAHVWNEGMRPWRECRPYDYAKDNPEDLA